MCVCLCVCAMLSTVLKWIRGDSQIDVLRDSTSVDIVKRNHKTFPFSFYLKGLIICCLSFGGSNHWFS